MRNLLYRIKKANFDDLKKNGDLEVGKIICVLEDEDFNYRTTKLYKTLTKLDEDSINNIIIHILTGRELSRYYGTTLKIKFNEYIEYFKECDIINKTEKMAKMEYICLKRRKLNNYIDTVLRYL